MTLDVSGDSTPLGKGSITRSGLIDAALLDQLRAYKRRVAGVYKAITPDALDLTVAGGLAIVSPKIDGELWYLVADADQVVLLSPAGHVIQGDIPILAAMRTTLPQTRGRTVIAGELFAAVDNDRPRVGTLVHVLASGTETAVASLKFMAFDLVAGGDVEAQMPLATYAQRFDVLKRLLPEAGALHIAPTVATESADETRTLWNTWINDGIAEGLILRAASGVIYKAKPEITLDAVVVAFTERSGEPGSVRSLLLGLVSEDGAIQLVGGCCNNGGDHARRDLFVRLSSIETASTYRYASDGGGLYRFVRPELIVEVRVTDIQAENAEALPVRSMALTCTASGWQPAGSRNSVSLLHASVLRVRTDKTDLSVDARIAQLAESGFAPAQEAASSNPSLPLSTVVGREVWTKEAKGAVSVRKYVAWKTNKEALDPDFPAYVVHWTDYSPIRASPLEREVRTAPSEAELKTIIAGLIAENIKTGWLKVDSA